MLARFSLLLLSAALLVGCSTRDPRLGHDTLYLGADGSVYSAPQRERPSYDNVSYWDGDGVPGAPRIEIRLSEQRAYFYKGNELVGVSAISAGREGYDTPVGKFKVIQKSKDHSSSLYGDYVDAVTGEIVQANISSVRDKRPPGTVYRGAKMPYFLRIVGATGLHAGFLPGYPASHGCIRLPEFMAEAFFNHVKLGTPVEVLP